MKRIRMRRRIARRITHLVILFSLFLIPQTALGQQEDEELKKLPGYVDFDAWRGFKSAESTVEIYIKEPILSLVARLAGDEDSELAKLLSNLKLIRVQTYPLEASDTNEIKAKVDRILKKLERDTWKILLRAREPDEQVHVYIKSSKDRVDGLVIMTATYGKEISFVNIVGDVDLNSIARLGDKFDIPGLDSLKTQPNAQEGNAP